MRELRIEHRITEPECRSVGLYLSELARMNRAGLADETAVVAKVQQGDLSALHCLAEAHLRFVISVAKRYQGNGVPLADLINEGNMGLLDAASRFDASKGVKFISYAVFWIRRYLLVAVSTQNRLIRLPSNEIQAQADIRKVTSGLLQELQRDPTITEVAERLGLAEEKIAHSLASDVFCLSGDRAFPDDPDGATLFDTLAAAGPLPDELVPEKKLAGVIADYVRTLGPRERQIMEMCFGLNGRIAMRNTDVGLVLGLSPERIRQIQVPILADIRERFRNVYEDETCYL